MADDLVMVAVCNFTHANPWMPTSVDFFYKSIFQKPYYRKLVGSLTVSIRGKTTVNV